MAGRPRAADAVVVGLATACMSPAGGVPASRGSGGGPLGQVQDDSGSAPQRWVGYDAATVSEGGTVVCDRVWDTEGATSDLACEDCAFVVELRATMRDDVGTGEDCPPSGYEVTYGYRSATASDTLPLGLLALQPGGWVWIGDATWDGERLVGSGRLSDEARETNFSVVGRMVRTE